MADNRPCRRDLRHYIDVVSFAADDVKLFLDTHPDCREALEFFDDCQAKRALAPEGVCKVLRPPHCRHSGPLGDRPLELDQ